MDKPRVEFQKVPLGVVNTMDRQAVSESGFHWGSFYVPQQNFVKSFIRGALRTNAFVTHGLCRRIVIRSILKESLCGKLVRSPDNESVPR